jgi:hypothetical protein
MLLSNKVYFVFMLLFAARECWVCFEYDGMFVRIQFVS